MRTKTRRIVWAVVVAATTLAVSLLLMTALTSAQAAKGTESPHTWEQLTASSGHSLAPTQDISVTFPGGDWPWYAQEEISVHPEPPIAGHPTELCAEVINLDPINPHTVTLEFSVANFGIGVPFNPVGQTDVVVPPGGHAIGCVTWVPPEPGHWCIRAAIKYEQHPPLISQRNIDIWERLVPGVEDQLVFPVGPFPETTTISFTAKNILNRWIAYVDPISLTLGANEPGSATLKVTPPMGEPLGSREVIADVEGYVRGELIGGFRKLDWPPVPLHRLRDPFFAESEIDIWPYPPRAGEPTQICVELFNLSDEPQIVEVQFSWANFGIGLPFKPINGPIVVVIPPWSHQSVCTWWIPPFDGHFCVQVKLDIHGNVEYHTQFSQRNLDVVEPLKPGIPHVTKFPVGNFFNEFTNPELVRTDIWLEKDVHLPGWEVTLIPDVLLDVAIEEIRWVTMTVTPSQEGLPPDGAPVVDVRAMVERMGEPHVIGGFRKIFRPPVPLHRFPDPPYAEREITIHPYPPRAGEPTEVCVELYNPTPFPQEVMVFFSWANFGIGIPFTPINGPRVVHLPPHSIVKECIHWIPPVSGHVCLQVELEMEGYPPQRSQRNVDVDEPLKPGEPHTLPFPVGNPFKHPVTITLGLIPHLPGWEFGLSEDVLLNMDEGEHRVISLTVVPPPGVPLPHDGEPIVDVEAYAEGELIGGFRKIHRPPIPLHPFPDPPYAEREITIHPYPPLAGEPTEVCVELYNPTPFPHDVTVFFSWAHFGIGIPFTPINGPRPVHLPPFSIVKECIHWIPPVSGHVCLQVELEMEGYPPQRSQRNIDVDEPLKPGESHSRPFPVGNPTNETVTITLGLVPHRDGWEFTLSDDTLPSMEPHAERVVTLTVVPPADQPLPPDGEPIVDVEGYIEGELIGGFRKVHRPPIPLHPFPDPPYAEREITVHPYPPLAGEPTEVCVELRNPTPFSQDVVVFFSWAHFGIGIPFTPINGPRPVHLPPFSIVKECIHWIPPVSGHVCLQVELEIEGHPLQRSQRNIDVNEPLKPGEPHTLPFPVGNPFEFPVTITLGLVPYVDGWEFVLSDDVLPNVEPQTTRVVSLTVRPPDGTVIFPPDEILPPEGRLVVDIEAYVEGELIGGFRKVFRPPIPLHPFPDPPYAEREITVEPYPPRAGEPTEVCVELRNPTPFPQDVTVLFSWADFGIGLPFQPINGPRTVHLPPFSIVRECIHWVPPHGGHLCLQVELEMEGFAPQWSQRNIDVDEPLIPGEPHSRPFPVGNPFDHPVTITLGLVPHLPDWGLELSHDVLTNVLPGPEGVREVILTVTPPRDLPLPEDGTPIVDVEAYVEGELIGGFRKIFRPPVPIHRPKDPIYAESEIFVHPYPPRDREPTELGVEIRNPTDEPQTVTVTFSYANFGIGLPFTPIHEPIVVEVPPEGMIRPIIMWIPPHEGLWCIQVEIELPDHEEIFYSQRNIDVGEPLEPNTPHSRPFPVGNPFNYPVTITLGLIPHFPDWGLELSQDVLTNVLPGPEGIREVILTVTPPADLPADGDPIVDVEAYVEGDLIGGFRKIFRPPVPVHRPKDPVYAESEIGVDPYPVVPGHPTELSVEVFNPTDEDHIVTVTFSIAPFGIGLPFSTTHIAPNPVHIFVPKFGAARGHVLWEPPHWRGKFCVRVTLEMEGHEPIWSQRNIDVGEPLKRGEPHSLVFPVGPWPYSGPVTVTLGLINHRDGWDTSLSETTLPNLTQPVSVTLTVTPSLNARLGTGDPIVDVEGYVEGELIGGFRKMDRPPIPIHKPHEKGYAESEISIDPYPPQLGQDSRVGAVVQNTSNTTVTVELEFGWAGFGMGIPFTTTGMVPYTRSVTLGSAMTATAWVTWTPSHSGHQCILVILSDPDDQYEPQRSQRNVDVVERPPCGEPQTYPFTVGNDTPFTVTVDIGLITFDVPEDWIVTVTPSDTLELGPYSEGVIIVTVEIPCSFSLSFASQSIYALQQEAGGVPTIDVEGYINGELVGGIELQLQAAAEKPTIYLPLVLKDWS